jgi:membrane protein DedA with SNARE-associated domain
MFKRSLVLFSVGYASGLVFDMVVHYDTLSLFWWAWNITFVLVIVLVTIHNREN